jgi:iron complex outermembrane recepter protein
VSISTDDGRSTSHFACGFFAPASRQFSTKRWLRCSAAPLALLACLSAGAALAQTATPAGQQPGELGPVIVTEPKRKPVKRTSSVEKRAPASTRVANRHTGRPAAPAPAATDAAPSQSPLNTNGVAASASRLGLTVREIPATVEVIDQNKIRDQGYRTTTEVAQGAVGVTAGDGPGEPGAFSMRGFSNSQINVLYNGIKIGPQNMTSRYMDTANLDSVEILKGPASLLSGEGASGGAINFVNKQPTSGPVQNEAFFSYDSLNSFRSSYGSGGSTNVQGLDYRFDISRSSLNGFIDDTDTKTFNVSGQLNYKISENLKIWGAVEYKQDHSNAYWGTPLVPVAFSGPNATHGIVSGTYVSNDNGTNLGAITIDGRTLTTNYNVANNYVNANELWVRSGFELAINDELTLKSQVYNYSAQRQWQNSEVAAFNSLLNMVDRERFYVAHDQELVGNITDLTWNTKIAGMDNRLVTTVAVSNLDFGRPGAANFPHDDVPLVDPSPGLYGVLTTQNQTAVINNQSLSFEDRLKITQAFALIGGVRVEGIQLGRNSTDITGADKAGFPFSKDWTPVTGRIGYTWEPIKGMTFYSQYATGADVAANDIFLLAGTQPLNLTTSQTYETGVKQVLWGDKAEWSLSLFDIDRQNVYAAAGGMTLNIAGQENAKGVEISGAIKPTTAWKFWGNFAFVNARYADYDFTGGSFSGNTPPNVPSVVANAGASYRFDTRLPVEIGMSARYVGDRYNSDANTVIMNAYTVADAYVFVDIPKYFFPAVDQTRITFRVRNLFNREYAAWGDPFYPDQILLGAPRAYELAAAFKW